MNDLELHPDRLSTTDASGNRIFLHPADVKGFFRNWRSRTQFILIIFFLILPWIRIHDRQALLLNLADRQFEIFGLSLRAHNAPLLLLLVAASAFALFFATAVFGRIWCGWACPQTVFIDGVFRRIERWIEGAALSRKKLDQAPWTAKKLSLRIFKWSLFTLISLVLTHSFLAYFVGTEKLSVMMQHSPFENPGDFAFIFLTTALILFDFGWFREQFCTIVCPYGRFQSVLMDRSSLVVSYDKSRGEPRATPELKVLAKTNSAKLGDCVNCYRCVQVCPTGIDIRRGVQMECIACTACIDACDDVMTKIKKPTGLIRYDRILRGATWKQKLNPRALSYLALCLLSLGLLTYFLFSLKPIEVEILRARDTPYSTQTLADGTIIVVNHFKIELSNQSGQKQNLTFGIVPENSRSKEFELVMAGQPYEIAKDAVQRADIFIRFPKSRLTNGLSKIRIFVKGTTSEVETEKEVTLVGPFS